MIADDARVVAVTIGQHQPDSFTAAPQTITCSCGDTITGGAVQHIQHTALAIVTALQLRTAEQLLEADAAVAAERERIAARFEGMAEPWGGDQMWITTGTKVARLAAEITRDVP